MTGCEITVNINPDVIVQSVINRVRIIKFCQKTLV